MVALDESEVVVAGDGETDSADARIEVEDGVGLDMIFNLLQCEFVDGEIDLEKAVWGVGVSFSEESVGQVVKNGVGAVFLEEAAGDSSPLIRAEEERLVFVGGLVTRVKVGEDFGSGGGNFWTLEGTWGGTVLFWF